MNSALDYALQAIYDAIETMDESALLIHAKCRALLHGYHKRWESNEYQPTAVEQMVTANLFNPKTNAKSRTFTLAGKLDVVADYRGKATLIDHKTTSSDIEDPCGPFWENLQIDGQISLYMLLEWQNGRKVDECVWDVVRKPSISPKKITKAEKVSVTGTRKYFDQLMSDETLLALQTEDRETLEMYEARLIHDCTKERPEWYFQRRTIPRLDNEILEYAGELWDHCQDIIHTRAMDRHLRNPGACMLYGSPCKFLGICSGRDRPDSQKWTKKNCVHNELELQGDGRDVITNSRIRCFQTCRRKHYFEYELGIERVDEEEKEALFFGRLWHIGLEAYWKFFMEPSDLAEAENINPF
jgi:hypothetical protein